MSSISVLGVGIHEGLDGAEVKIVSLEKVTIIYTNPGCCYHYSFNGHTRIGPVELLAVVYLCLNFNKSDVKQIYCVSIYIFFWPAPDDPQRIRVVSVFELFIYLFIYLFSVCLQIF